MEGLSQLVVGPNSTQANQYARHLRGLGRMVSLVTSASTSTPKTAACPSQVPLDRFGSDTCEGKFDCLVLYRILDIARDEPLLRRVEAELRTNSRATLFLVSSALVHSGDLRYARAESLLRIRFGPLASRVVTLRVTNRVDPATLSHVIDAEKHSQSGRHYRTMTLLGPTSAIAGQAGDTTDDSDAGVRSFGSILPRRGTELPETLSPTSVEELLTLYHPYSYQQVQLAGYNTGVKHFGWTFPGKTVVKTIRSGKRARVRGDYLDVDAGLTLKQAMECLRQAGKEFYVVPNYSYIGMGTIFFVPVHGSGSDVSTLGDTIEKALLYLPDEDRFERVVRGDENFGRFMYRPESKALVLRLTFRIRDQTRYFVSEFTHAAPASRDIVNHLSDVEAANVEIRKSHAADDSVTIRKYYDHDQTASGKPLELPKDSLGRLWDRLEETPVVSHLFHEYVRRFGYHVELFLSEPQFDRFWASHQELPLKKIQLRRMRRDGLPHSPCADSDRISADLFMKRSDKERFLTFIANHLPDVRFNPGKHSK